MGTPQAMAKVTAKLYYIEFGPDIDSRRISRFAHSTIAPTMLKTRPLEWWEETIARVLMESEYAAIF